MARVPPRRPAADRRPAVPVAAAVEAAAWRRRRSEASRRRPEPPSTRILPGRLRALRGGILICRVRYSSDDMRGVPLNRPPAQASRESLTPEEYLQRASGDEANKFSSVNTETLLRNEYGIRTFGYTSLIVDPPDGRQPAVTPAERARRAGAARAGHVQQRRAGRFRRLLSLRSLHLAWRAGIGHSGALWQRRPLRAVADRGGDDLRDDSRVACHSPRQPGATGASALVVDRLLGRTLGRRYAGRGDQGIQRTHRYQPEPDADRVVHSRRSRDD